MNSPAISSDLDTTALVAGQAAPAAPSRLRRGRGFTLGLAWLHGSLDAAVFRRQTMVADWTCPSPVRTLDEFAAALDQALAALDFAGAELFLVLDHDSFIHRMEAAPSFSEDGARTYLQGRVNRYEMEGGRMLWASQKMALARQDSSYLLHLLPVSFYDRLNQIMLVRRLNLTRILPLVVPLTLELEALPAVKDEMTLLAAETGAATTLIIGRPGGGIVLARTILGSWRDESARVGVEINRSLLYAKQQFGTVVDRIWLLGGDEATEEVRAKCGPAKEIMARPTKPVDWLRLVAKLSPRYSVNLVAGRLRRERGQAFFRRALIAACWLALMFVAVDFGTRMKGGNEERRRLAALGADETPLRAERGRLEKRNNDVERDRAFDRQVLGERLPPVPGHFLAYLAGILPKEMRLTDFNAKWDGSSGGWSSSIGGRVEADPETARVEVAALQERLEKGPFHAHLESIGRGGVPAAAISASASPPSQTFSLEGGLFENLVR